MIERLKRVIERGQIKHPTQSVATILFNRFFEIQLERFRNFKMNAFKDSTFTSEKDLFMCSLFPINVLDIVMEVLKPKSVLDVGCGTGKTLDYLLQYNIDAIGIENSAIAISKSPVKEKIIKHNLKYPINLKKQFDLVWCFEVVEHIHPHFEEIFLNTLVDHSNKILISAAKPGQGGHGHFNEKEQEYWIGKFKKLGYLYNETFSENVRATKDNHSENLMFFEKINL